MKSVAFAALLALSAGPAYAAPQIVNLNASSSNPNAGKSSGGYAYNPVTLTLASGIYSVKVAGIVGGGLYDAYSVYAPSGNNAAYTDSAWGVSLNGGVSSSYTQGNVGGSVADYDGNFKAGRYSSAAAAVSAYSAASPYTFTLASTTAVSFFVDDSSSPYFGDDTGGVSLAVSQVPEPGSLGLLAVGVAGVAFAFRRRGGARLA